MTYTSTRTIDTNRAIETLPKKPASDIIDEHNTQINNTNLVNIRTGNIISLHNSIYKFDKKVGKGSYATVWSLITDDTSAPLKNIALKVNRAIPFFFKVAEIEYQLLNNIGNESRIVPFLEDPIILPKQNIFAIPMEAFTENLLTRLSKKPLLSQSLELLTKLSEKYALLHEKGIIHADMKPENIVLKDDDIRIIDLGLSFEKGKNIQLMHQSLYYRAPEVSIQKEAERIDENIDIWSFGCMLYEMITGDVLVSNIDPNFCSYKRENFPFFLSLLGRPSTQLLEEGNITDENILTYRSEHYKEYEEINLSHYPKTKSLDQVADIFFNGIIFRIPTRLRDNIDVKKSILEVARLLAEIIQWDPKSRPSMECIHQKLIQIDFSILNFQYSRHKSKSNSPIWIKPSQSILIDRQRYCRTDKGYLVKNSTFYQFNARQRVIKQTFSIAHIEAIKIKTLASQTIYSKLPHCISNETDTYILSYDNPLFLELIRTDLNFEKRVSIAKNLCHFFKDIINLKLNQEELESLAYIDLSKIVDIKFKLNHYRNPRQLNITMLNPEHNKKVDVWHLGCLIYLLFTEKTFLGRTPPCDLERISDKVIKYIFKKQPQENESFLASFAYNIKKHTNYPQNQVHQIASLLTFILQYNPNSRPSIDEILKHPLFTATAE